MSFRSIRSASRCLLETLPLEILIKIYLYSENPSFASVNKHISKCLSSQLIRLQFCVRLFCYRRGPSLYHNEKLARNLGRAQTLVFQQPWFSNHFARKVQREIMRVEKARQGTVSHRRLHPYRHVRAAGLAQVPRGLLLQKSWGQTKVKLIHRLLKWGVRLPGRPNNIQREALTNAILENNYRAVSLLHTYGKVHFHHKHFQAAVLHDCERRIVEMIVETNNQGRRPFIDLSDKRIYKHAMELDQAGNPMCRRLLEDLERNKRNLAIRTRRVQRFLAG